MSAQLSSSSPGVYKLAGSLDFDSVPTLLEQSRTAFSGQSSIVADLADVAHSNSAGLALLLEWQAWAVNEGWTLTLQNLPDSLRQIAQVCEVESLLV